MLPFAYHFSNIQMDHVFVHFDLIIYHFIFVNILFPAYNDYFTFIMFLKNAHIRPIHLQL